MKKRGFKNKILKGGFKTLIHIPLKNVAKILTRCFIVLMNRLASSNDSFKRPKHGSSFARSGMKLSEFDLTHVRI